MPRPLNATSQRNLTLLGLLDQLDRSQAARGSETVLDSSTGIPRGLIPGSTGNDILIGGIENDTLTGGKGNDTLNSGAGNDTLIGIDPTDVNLGRGEIDVLTGGSGNDLFILGNASGVFYNDRNSISSSRTDYARVTDFGNGDRIQLKGKPSDYILLSNDSADGYNGVGLYLNDGIFRPGTYNPDGWDARDEFIALIQVQPGTSTLSLTNLSQFTYVTDETISGDNANNILNGGEGNDTLIGGKGSDTLIGGAGTDTLIGIDLNDESLGRGEIDVITGGSGNDLFILGNASGVFYNDGNTTTSGFGDYAGITNFENVNKIQLKGQSSDYSLIEIINNGTITGYGLYLNDGQGSGANATGWDSSDELIAVISRGRSNLQLSLSNLSQFTYITDYFIRGSSSAFEKLNGGVGNDTVDGGLGRDELNGGSGNDTLIGGKSGNGMGPDILNGDAGEDVLIGIDLNDVNLGRGENGDILTGGLGNDLFVLGDASGIYYNDGDATQSGRGDSALIKDFTNGDRIQLKGKASDYIIRLDDSAPDYSGARGVGLYRNDGQGNGENPGGWDSSDEFIALIQVQPGTSPLSLSNLSQFTYVTDQTISGGTTNDILIGGAGNDTINAGAGNDNLLGNKGNDSLNGGAGADTLIGSDQPNSYLFLGETDILTGGADNDLFVLGNASSALYNDGNTEKSSRTNYARITDFTNGDRIQLKGKVSDYVLRSDDSASGFSGVGLYLNDGTAGVGFIEDGQSAANRFGIPQASRQGWDTYDEFIGLIQVQPGTAPLSLSNLSQFTFV